jgi:hypothetical protein
VQFNNFSLFKASAVKIILDICIKKFINQWLGAKILLLGLTRYITSNKERVMSFVQINASVLGFLSSSNIRGLLFLLFLVFVGCSSQITRQTEIEALDARRMAAEQEAVQIEEERRRQVQTQEIERIALEERRREAEIAERERIAEERRQEQEVAARELAEATRRRREELEQERSIALADRQVKLARIAQLEVQISAIQSELAQNGASAALIQDAILAAEELLAALRIEQNKYERTDSLGNTVEPLAKDLIVELEARLENLAQRARSL